MSKLRPSAFIRNVLTLFTGTALGHVITLALSVVVTRLYDPEMFASLEQFAMILAIFGAIGGGKYEAAIMLADDEEDARSVLLLSIRIALITGAVMALTGWWLAGPVSELLGNEAIAQYLWLTGPTTTLLVTATALGFWFSRVRTYRPVAISKTVFPAVSEPSKIAFASAGVRPGGLIFSVVAGHLISTSVLIWKYLRSQPLGFRYLQQGRLLKVRRQFIDYPRFALPGSLLNRTAQWLHIALFGWLFGNEGLVAVGIMALSRRLVMGPLNMLSSSFSQVYFQRLTEIEDGPPLLKYYRRSLGMFGLVSLFMIVLVWLLPDRTTAVIFGEEWYEVMGYLRILIFWFAANFVVSSTGFVLHRARGQKLILLLDAIHLSVVVLSLAIAWYGGANIKETLVAFTAGKVMYYAMNLLVTTNRLKQQSYEQSQ